MRVCKHIKTLLLRSSYKKVKIILKIFLTYIYNYAIIIAEANSRQTNQEGIDMAEKLYLVIEHDNGVSGQYGFTDYEVDSIEEAEEIVESYRTDGITVYRYTV